MAELVKDGFTQLVEDGKEIATLGGASINTFQRGNATVNEKLKSVLKLLASVFGCFVGFYSCLFRIGQTIWRWMKKFTWAEQLIVMICGVVLCFFGGIYIVSLAALEAVYRMGGAALADDLFYVWKVADKVSKDVLKSNEPFDQKAIYESMVKIDDPMKLQSAFGNLWSCYVAVLATLSLQFAQIVAIALGMAACIRPTVLKLLRPPIARVLKHESWQLHHWLDHHKSPDGRFLEDHAEEQLEGESVFISSLINVIVLWVAWSAMAFVAAFYAGLRGGRMFADAFLGRGGLLPTLLKGYGLMPDGSLIATVLDPTGYADEVVMYVLAAFGIWSQITSGFSIFFPLNIVLLPLSAIEWFLRYQITFGGHAPAGAA